MSNTTKHNTRFTGKVSPTKERKPVTGQVRKSDQAELHNADMRALIAAKKTHERLKRYCITIRLSDITITGLPATLRHRLEYMGFNKQQIEEMICNAKKH